MNTKHRKIKELLIKKLWSKGYTKEDIKIIVRTNSIHIKETLGKKLSEENDKSIKCKYCGKNNGSKDEDVLCKSCREDFGHSFYSEL